jgi:hypothetical protein
MDHFKKTTKNAERNKTYRSRNEGEERNVGCIRNAYEEGYARKGKERIRHIRKACEQGLNINLLFYVKLGFIR